MNYSSLGSMWDIAHAPSQFSQLPDDDFLALLHKQFSPTDPSDHSVSPQSVQNLRQSPPSDDSSPSPLSNTDATSRPQSIHVRANDTEDTPLKRKASSDDMEAGPSSKNQHTADDGSSTKKPQPSRRKSTGNSQHDESRLLKRKEQNRAAQRAFRERKEKHVKDLEDKVAALEAKNEATEAENTNLRDLLSRLQQENLSLKQAQFTFSVPKPPPIPAPTSGPPFNFFGAPSPFPPTSAPAQTPSNPSAFGTDIDWNSLTTFDPSVLSVLDEPPDVPMQTDSSPSPFGQYALPQTYKTIANNPLLMSFVDESPSASSNTTSSANSFEHFTFNFSSPSQSWTSPSTQSPSFTQNNVHSDFLHPNHSLDELFGGNFVSNQGPLDFNVLADTTSVSPVQTGESPPSASESTSSGGNGSVQSRLFSRSDVAKQIAAEGLSPFADPNSSLRKTTDMSAGDMISCQGTKFPPTKESPDNIEALKAWRCITQDPHFKDADINELCTEFAKKARCDGTKVVLEPDSVHQLFEMFQKLRQLSTQQPQSDPPSS